MTVVYQGELEHRDSAGNQGTIGAGDVQWMTAASGVVHEEYHSPRFTRQGGVLEMVQLWVNLPAKNKMSPPRYQGLLDRQIPAVELPARAGTVRVIAGDFQGVKGPAQVFTPIELWDVQLAAGGEVQLPVLAGHMAALDIQRGTVKVNGGESATAGELVLFDRNGSDLTLQSAVEARALLLAGEPLREPVAGQGPFVMNTREQIQQAIVDYQAGRMGHLA